ncbi:MAG: hemerythrin domain-containing protein [Rhodospirillales bacterium]|nr:hemerythrin domain-containing protein [Rhodospirillales bacterium]
MPTARTGQNGLGRREVAPDGDDALAVLRQDHETVTGLLEDYEAAQDRMRKAAIADRISRELTIHSTIEAEVFFPRVREAFEDDDNMEQLLAAAELEHDNVMTLIDRLDDALDGGGPDAQTDERIRFLIECVDRHVEIQEGDLFPQIEQAELDLAEIGEALRTRREELQDELA